jgi:hypothetical protein
MSDICKQCGKDDLLALQSENIALREQLNDLLFWAKAASDDFAERIENLQKRFGPLPGGANDEH